MLAPHVMTVILALTMISAMVVAVVLVPTMILFLGVLPWLPMMPHLNARVATIRLQDATLARCSLEGDQWGLNTIIRTPSEEGVLMETLELSITTKASTKLLSVLSMAQNLQRAKPLKLKPMFGRGARALPTKPISTTQLIQ
jgi:hypothetical protein